MFLKHTIKKSVFWGLGIGGLGIAQSPIPNPQSPINNTLQ